MLTPNARWGHVSLRVCAMAHPRHQLSSPARARHHPHRVTQACGRTRSWAQRTAPTRRAGILLLHVLAHDSRQHWCPRREPVPASSAQGAALLGGPSRESGYVHTKAVYTRATKDSLVAHQVAGLRAAAPAHAPNTVLTRLHRLSGLQPCARNTQRGAKGGGLDACRAHVVCVGGPLRDERPGNALGEARQMQVCAVTAFA